MNCRIYKASNNKHLLNIDNFTYGDSIYCRTDRTLKLIEVDKEYAEQFCEEFNNENEQIRDEESHNALKSKYSQKLQDDGYDLTNLVNYELNID